MFKVFEKLLRRAGPQRSLGECERCHGAFAYELIHNGFGDTAYAYCDRCGTTALLSGWYQDIPAGAPLRVQGPIESETEVWLQPCSCGGTFRRNATPRCPHCNAPLSAEIATRYIEKNAHGTKKGWRWQRSWLGMYGIVIEGRIVNNWRRRPVGQ